MFHHQIPEHDVIFGDISCQLVKNCASKIPHSPEEAKELCNHEEQCKGFAFTSSNDVYFKNDLTGKIVLKLDVTLYLKKKYTLGLKLPRAINCAVSMKDVILTNFSGGCRLPELDPFNPSMLKLINKPEHPLSCPGRRLTRYRNGILEFIEKGTSSSGIDRA